MRKKFGSGGQNAATNRTHRRRNTSEKEVGGYQEGKIDGDLRSRRKGESEKEKREDKVL